MFWGVKPGGWSDRSRMLAWALVAMEESTGPEGHPIDEELDFNTNGRWQAKVIVNEASAERERFLAEHKDGLEPGAYVVIERKPEKR